MKRLIFLIGLTCGLGFFSGIQAQDFLLPRSSPESVGMSADRLARFDTVLMNM